MKNNQQWSRRKFSKAVISAQLFLASGGLSVAVACASDNKSNAPTLLSEAQQNLLVSAMDELIPSTTDLPSASAAGGLDYLFKIIKDFSEFQQLFKAICNSLDEYSHELYGGHFGDLDQQKRVRVLEKQERENEALFNQLKNFVYEGYYLNPEIWKKINYESFPTGTAGPKMKPFDESLLDRVRNTPSSYINI